MNEHIQALKLKLSREEARKIAEKKGDWLWQLVFKRLPLSQLKLMYIEYEIIRVKTTSASTALSHLRKKESREVQKYLDILVNGTTGGVALITDQNLCFEELAVNDDMEIQHGVFDRQEAVKRAKMLAHKVTHRMMGGMHETEVIERFSVYRPFWVAFYGDMVEGNKVRYITIPADGGQNQRAR